MTAQKIERAAMHAEKKQVAELFESGDIDGAAEQAANSARAGVYKKAELKEKLSAVLTAEQLQQLQDMKKRKMHNKPRHKQDKNKQAREQ